MKPTGNNSYDPEENVFKKYVGKVPGHIVAYSEGNEFTTDFNRKTRKKIRENDNILDPDDVVSITSLPINLTIRIAPEASKINVKDEKGNEVTGDELIDMEIRYTLWYKKETPKGFSWMNKDYVFTVEEVFGIRFPEDEIEVKGNKHWVKEVLQIEEEDVYGLPVLADVGITKDGKYQDIKSLEPWDGGQRLELDQDEDEDDEAPWDK